MKSSGKIRPFGAADKRYPFTPRPYHGRGDRQTKLFITCSMSLVNSDVSGNVFNTAGKSHFSDSTGKLCTGRWR